MTNRRDFLKALAAGAALAGSPSRAWLRAQRASDPWDELPRILARIKPPTIPRRDFDVMSFGAVGDNVTDNTDAFHAAIAACSRAGGGRVVVPPGAFLAGAIEVKSRVNLHLASGSTIRFTRDSNKYPVVFSRWEGMELMNFSPLIYAVEKGVPVRDRVFGPGHYLRPQFIQPYRCTNVLIEGVTLLNAPMWQVHPVLCSNVTIKDLSIHSNGPNTDGCDPESCRDVLITNCSFDTGDDCIAIKSGRNADGRRVKVPSENIVIQQCRMTNGHGAITVGSEISAGVRNVFAEDCRVDSPLLEHVP